MGTPKSFASLISGPRKNAKKLKKRNGSGNGNGKRPVGASRFFFESMEPRILLSSDLSYTGAAAFDLTLRYDQPSQKLQLIDNATSTTVQEQNLADTSAVVIHGSTGSDHLTVDLSTLFTVSGGIIFDDSTTGDNDRLTIENKNSAALNDTTQVQYTNVEQIDDRTGAWNSPGADQVFYLDIAGAQDVTYDGPVALSGIDVPVFQATGDMLGHEADIVSSLLAALGQTFAGTGISFTVERPATEGKFSTIYIGGDDSAFADYGPFAGLAEKIDIGNKDASDIGFIFTDNITGGQCTTEGYAEELAQYVSHEAGHLMGYEHAYKLDTANPLSAVGFKPYVHIEIAKDVRADLLDDGKLTVGGQTYDVNPTVVEAIRKYPAYFYAGSVGPDGFPELVMGGTVIHPDSTGIWVQHILDKAWEVQNSTDYSPEEKLQALAFAYGYPMHVAADTWSHTLVNEFSEGVWPDLKMALQYNDAKANIIRHLLVEGYIADATPGYDGVKTVDDQTQRTVLPDGDVSSDATMIRELEIPTRFVFDALIDDLPDLPAEVQRFLFSITPAETGAYAGFDPSVAESWRGIFHDKEIELNDGLGLSDLLSIKEIELSDNPRMTVIEPDAVWEIKSDYYFYTIKAVKDADGATARYEVFSTYKSRGPVADYVIDMLRPLLVHLAQKLEAEVGQPGDPNIDPLAGLIDPLMANMERLVRGDVGVNTDQLIDDLKSLASKISTSVMDFGKSVSSQGDIAGSLESFAKGFATALGVDAASYVRYWIKNVDEMLRHWPDLGLAISRGLFDPQQKRDLQNENGASYGSDLPSQAGTAGDPGLYDSLLNSSRRATAEKVDILDILMSELEDPNRDGSTMDSLVNQFMLPMIGMPKKLGELRSAIADTFEDLDQKLLQPVHQLLGEINPIAPLINWIKEEIKEYVKPIIYGQVRKMFGIDPYLLEVLNDSPSSKMDLRSIQTVSFSDIVDLSRSEDCVVTWYGHKLMAGDTIRIKSIDQDGWKDLNGTHVVKDILNGDQFTIEDDTSAIASAYQEKVLSRWYEGYGINVSAMNLDDLSLSSLGNMIVKEDYVADGHVGKVEELFIYKPTDHALIDQYLGIYGTDHHVEADTSVWTELANGTEVNLTFYPNAVGGLREDVEFDKKKYAAYADSVTLSKMLLFQENIPDVHLSELSKASQCTVTWFGHNLAVGDEIVLTGITQQGWTALNGVRRITSIVDANHVTIDVDTTAMPSAYNSNDPGKMAKVGAAADLAAAAVAGTGKCTLTWTNNDLAAGDRIVIQGVTQQGWTALNGVHTVTSVLMDGTFTIDVNTAGLAVAYDGGIDPGRIAEVWPGSPKTISKLLTNTTGQRYNFADPRSILLNGNHGGSVMTATMVGVNDQYGNPVSVLEKYDQPISGDLWLCIIDGGDNWRQDTMTGWNEDYRYHSTVGPAALTNLSREAACTITWNGHNLSVGDQVQIRDIAQTGWAGLNGTHTVASVVDADTITINVDTSGIAAVYDKNDPGTIEKVGDTNSDKVVWTFSGLAAGQYQVQTDWLINMAIRDQGNFAPSDHAKYTITTSGGETITSDFDQNTFPEDEVIGLDAWANVGMVTVGANGTITLTLDTRVVNRAGKKDGDFVVAGRARIHRTDGTGTAQIITNRDTGKYQETSAELFRWDASSPVAAADELDLEIMPQEVLNAFEKFGYRLIEPQFFILSSNGAYQDAIENLNGDNADNAPTLTKALKDRFSFRGFNVEQYSITPEAAGVWTVTTTLSGGENRTFEVRAEHEYVVEAQKETDVLNVYDLTDRTFFVRKVENTSNEWQVVNQQKWGMVAITEAGVTFQRLRNAEKYTLKLDNGTFTVARDWEGIAYPLGTGNMPLWESDVLRPAFRSLFTDWENGTLNFPDLGDATTIDPQGQIPSAPFSYGTFEPYIPYAPTLIAPAVTAPVNTLDSSGNMVVSGDAVVRITPAPNHPDIAIGNITGNDDGTADSLTILIGDVAAIGAAASSGTTVTFGTAHGLAAGDLIGNDTNGYRTVLSVTSDTVVEVDRAFTADLAVTDALNKLSSDNEYTVTVNGFIGGGGLKNISIHTGGKIVLADGATMTSRQIDDDIDNDGTPDANHWNAVSTAASGSIILKAPTITIGDEANLLAHATTGFAAGDVRMIARDEVRKTWALLGIPDFGWRKAESGIEIGMGARITGDDIGIDTLAWAQKVLTAQADPEFSFPTRSVLLSDLNADGNLDLIVGNNDKPNRFYLNDGTGTFGYGVDIDTANYHTTSMAVGDVDNDSIVELIVGNYDESWDLGKSLRMYKWDSAAHKFGAGTDIAGGDKKTTTLTLANVDADANLELIAGTNKEGVFLYDWAGSSFGSPTQIESATTYRNTSLAVADIDNDSNADLVVGNYLNSNGAGQAIRLYRNNGSGFDAGVDVDAARKTTALVLGNVDGDPAMELIVGTDGEGILQYEYNGTGFTAGTAIDTAAYATTSLALRDVDADTDLDLVAGNNLQLNRLYLNTGGSFTGQNIGTEASSTTSLALGNVKGDGKLELVVGIDRMPNQLYDLQSIEGTTGQVRTGYLFGKDIGVDPSLMPGAVATDGPDISNKKAKAVIAEATTGIVIGEGAYLSAGNDVILSSLAHAEAQITTIRSGWGVTYGNASSKADIDVLTGALILAGHDFQMKAKSENDVNVLTFIPSVGESTNIALSLAIGISNTDDEIRSGADVRATHAEITAENVNSFRNTAIAAGFGTAVNTDDKTGEKKSDETGVGATIVLGFLQSAAKAGVSGFVTTTEDTVIDAKSENQHNVTRSFASASGNPVGKNAEKIKGFMDGLPMDFGIGDDVMKVQSGEPKKAYAVAFAMETSDNSASAFLGDGAVIQARNLDITSLAKDAFQISASGSAGTVPGSNLETSFGGALAFSNASNRANAFIGWNARADVTGTVTVDAKAFMTSPVDPLDLTLALLGLGEATQAEALGAAYAYSEKMGGEVANVLGSPTFTESDFVDTQLNSLVLKLRAGETAATDTLAKFLWGRFSQGTKDLLKNPAASAEQLKKALTEEFNKIIQENASIFTQDRFSGVTLRPETIALGDTNKDNKLDNSDPALTNEADLVRFNRMLLEDAFTTELVKRQNAIAGYLMANLNDEEKIGTSFVHAGASDAAGGMAAGGGINVLFTYNAATAGIAKGAQVSAGQDVKVLARGEAESINMAGNTSVLNYGYNVLESPKTGIGGFLDVAVDQNYATAYIDDLAIVHADHDIAVMADTNNDLLTIAMAGSYAGKTALDGAFIYNRVQNAALAYIEDRAFVDADNDLTVDAQSDVRAITITPAISIGGQYGVGIGASFAHITDTTQAFIGDLKDNVPAEGFGDGTLTGVVTVGGDLSIHARSTPEIWTIGASAGIAPGGTDNGATETKDGQPSPSTSGSNGEKFGLGFSGSVAFNWVVQNTQAFIKDKVNVEVTGNADLEAFSSPTIIAGAGGFGFGNDWGIGGAYAQNRLIQNTKAFVENAEVTAASLDLYAHTNNDLIGVAASGAGAKESGAVAGGVNYNKLTVNVDAFAGDGAVINAGTLLINAASDTLLVSVTGALGIGVGGAFAVGADLGLTFIDSTVHATIAAGADVTGGDAKVFASNATEVVSVAAAVAVATDDGIGAAGSVTSVNLDNDVQAGIDAAIVNLSGSLYLDADDDSNVVSVAGQGAYGESAGFGISGTNVNTTRLVRAYIGADAVVDAKGNGSGIVDPGNREASPGVLFGGRGIFLDATANDHLLLFAAGGAGADTFAGAGSAVINTMNSTTEAFIGGGAAVNQNNTGAANDQSVRLRSAHDTFILDVAGSFAGAGTVGLGLAADVQVLGVNVKSHVDAGAAVAANGEVGVEATSDVRTLSIAAAGAYAGDAGLSGSASVVDVDSLTTAFIQGDGGTQPAVDANGGVVISADGEFKATMIAGAVGASGTAGVGASNTTLIHDDTVSAYVGQNTVVHADGGQGLVITATSREDILSIAAAFGAAGEVGVAGSATVNKLTENTSAYVDRGATISANNGTAAGAPNLVVTAKDETPIISVAGSLAAAGTVAVGVGADVGIFDKKTNAFIESGVTADVEGNILVTAGSLEDMTSVSAGLAASTVGVAANADVHVLNIATRAFIGDDPTPGSAASAGAGNVHARGSVALWADDVTTGNAIVGVLGAGEVGIAAAANVNVLNKQTLAFIGDGANVIGDGQGAGLTVHTGGINTGLDTSAGQYDPGAPGQVGIESGSNTTASAAMSGDRSSLKSSGTVGVPDLGPMDLHNTGSGSNDVQDDSLSGARTTSLATTTPSAFHGVAVTATNRDSMNTFTVSLAAGVVGVAVSAGVDVLNTDTSAFIGTGAHVNDDLTGASSSQSVLVGAGNDFYHLAVAGSLAAGYVGVAPAVGVVLVDSNTTAGIHANATVRALNDISVAAGSSEKVVTIGFGVAAGFVGVGGSVGVLNLTPTTIASIGNNATVQAGGDVVVLANDSTRILEISGAIAGGFVGVGGSVGVLTVDKTTQAVIGQGAHVDALGNGTGVSALDGSIGIGNTLGQLTTHGVVVQAQSQEDVTHLVITGSGGFVGVAGSVGVRSITGETDAIIGQSARINQADPNLDGIVNDGANALQSVFVNAADQVDLLSFAGAVTGGFVGVAGAVDVGTLNNNVSAKIGTGAKVNAKNDVSVNALGTKELDGFTVSGAGGFVGLSASVNVWSIGEQIDKSYQDNDGRTVDATSATFVFNPNDTGVVNQTNDSLDLGNSSLENGTKVTYSNGGGTSIGGLTDGGTYYTRVELGRIKLYDTAAHAKAGGATGLIDLSGGWSGSNHKLTGVSADGDAAGQAQSGTGLVTGALGNFAGNSSDGANTNQNLVHNGAASAISGINAQSLDASEISSLLNSAPTPPGTTAIIEAGAIIVAGDDIAVKANAASNFDITVGQVSGGFVAVGGAVGVFNIADNVTANAAGTFSADGDLLVNADLNETVDVLSLAGQFGFVGVGAAVVVLHDSSATLASLSGTVTKADSVTVEADTHRTPTIDTNQAQIGAVAAGASFTRLTVDGDTTASIGSGAQIGQAAGSTVGSLNVRADADIDAHAHARALSAGAVAISANFAFVDVNSDVTASIGSNAKIKLTGAALVHADGEMNANARIECGSFGVGATGASIGEANIISDVMAQLGGNASIETAGDITIESWFNHNGTAPTGNKAQSTANAPSVTVGLSASGTSSTAHNSGSSHATTGTGSSLSGRDVNVTALSSNVATTDNQNLTLSAGAAIGLSFSDSTADGTTGADVEGAVTATGDVTISTNATNTATATAQSPTAGLGISGVGTNPEAGTTQTVESKVGSTGSINATGAISITATSNSTATAEAKAISIGALAFGDSDVVANANGTVQSHMDGAVTKGSSLTIAATGISDADATTLASSGGLGTVNLAEASATASPTVKAYKDGSGNVTLSGSMNLTATSDADADARAKGLSIGLAGAKGSMKATSTVSPTVDTHIAGGTITTTNGGAITLTAAHNYGATAPLPDHGATATADAAGGGLGLSGQGAVPTATANADVNASVGSATLNAAGGITINAQAANVANADADALSVGLGILGDGASIANAAANGTTKAHMDGAVTGGTFLTIAATGYSDADANAEASGGGLISTMNPLASATASPAVKAYKDGSGNVTVNGSMSLTATSDADADTEAKGLSIGLAGAEGTMQATSTVSPTVDTHIAGGIITTTNGGGITLTAIHNYGVTAPLSDHGATAMADAAGGGLLASGQGAVPTATANANVNAYVGGATLNSAGSITIDAKAANVASANADALSIGIGIAQGESIADATADGTTKAHMDGTISAGTGLTIAAFGYSDADATADAPGGGILAGMGATAHAHVRPTIEASMAGTADVTLTGAGTILMTARSDSDADSNALAATLGGLARGSTGALSEIGSDVDVFIASGADIDTTGAITLKGAHDTTIDGGALSGKGANAYADTASAGLISGGGSNADAIANGTVSTRMAGSVTSTGGSISLYSYNANDAKAQADGMTAGLAGVGVVHADAISGGNASLASGLTAAFIDAYADIDAKGLTISAISSNTADADTVAAGYSGVAGAGSTANARVLPDVKAYIGSYADVDLTGAGTVAITGQSKGDADADAQAKAYGLVAAGASVSRAEVASDVDMYIAGGANVLTPGSITLTGAHNTQTNGTVLTSLGADAYGNGVSGAVLGGTGVDADAVANGTVATHVGGTVKSTGSGITVKTYNYNDANAQGDGLSAGLVGVGVILADAVSGANQSLTSGMTKAAVDASADIDATSLLVEAVSINHAEADTIAGGIAAIGITYSTAKATVLPDVQATIGASAQVDVTGTGGVTVTARSEGDAEADAKAQNIGIGVAAGATNAYAKVASDVDAGTDSNAHVTATNGPITITAAHNMTTAGGEIAKGADAHANAASAGIVSVQSAYSKAESYGDVRALTGTGSNLNGQLNVTVQALGFNDAVANTDGESYGLAGVGAVNADAYAGNASTYVQAKLGDSSTTEGSNVTVKAEHRADATAAVKQATGGLVAAGENSTLAKAAPVSDAAVGSSATVNADQDITVQALARGKADADSTGRSLGGLAVGKNNATAEWRPTTTAGIGSNADINAGDDIYLQAYNNYDAFGSQLVDLTSAYATNSVGAVIGISGSDARVTVDSYTRSNVSGGADLDAGVTSGDGEIRINALSNNNTDAEANGRTFAAIGVGSDYASVTINSDTIADTGSGTHLAGDTIIEMRSVSDNNADVDAIGSGGAIAVVSSNEPTAIASMQSDIITSSIGSYNDIVVGDLLDLSAVRFADVRANAQMTDGFNVVSANVPRATATIANAPATVSIGNNTTVDANRVKLTADDSNVYAEATTRSSTTADVYVDFLPVSTVNINVSATVFIGAGAQITAKDSVTILAREDNVHTYSYAFAGVDAGVASNLIVVANNTRTSTANVTAEATALITTKTLTVDAVGSYSTGSNERTYTVADKDAETLTEYVAEGTKTVCTIVGEVVCVWGLVCDPHQICEDVINWVLRTVGAASETHANRYENVSNSINFNANVHITGGGSPLLEIDSTGKVVGDNHVKVRDAYGNVIGLGGTVSTNSIYVDDILNDSPPGSIVMRATGGSTSGSSNIQFDAAFDTVTVLNHSDKNLFMNDIEVFNAGNPPTITHQAASANKNWTYNLASNASTSEITITNDSAADTDITLQGHFLNPGGLTTILNIGGGGGDILAVNSDAYIASRVVSLISDSGRVGADASNRIQVGLTVSGDGTGYT